ncbi:MAG TPA: DinB family protein [Saprospiraceae bacterium]|nr:DinB family protein [Saprospiraceae bacterium]
MNLISFPAKDEYHPFYQNYIDKVTGRSVIQQLKTQRDRMIHTIAKIQNMDFSYAPGKWTIRELLVHLLDAEMIFVYRALVVSRGETQPLISYDQEIYNANDFSHMDRLYINEMYKSVRNTTLLFFENLKEDHSVRRGTVMGNVISVRALAHIIAGHERHHMDILTVRYGIDL